MATITKAMRCPHNTCRRPPTIQRHHLDSVEQGGAVAWPRVAEASCDLRPVKGADAAIWSINAKASVLREKLVHCEGRRHSGRELPAQQISAATSGRPRSESHSKVVPYVRQPLIATLCVGLAVSAIMRTLFGVRTRTALPSQCVRETQPHQPGSLFLVKGVNNSTTWLWSAFEGRTVEAQAFLKALIIALGSALLALAIRLAASEGRITQFQEGMDEFLKVNTASWTGITAMLGFLIVFRASQAYARYFSAMTDVHLMRADVYDSGAALCAFCSEGKDPADEHRVRHFKHVLVRLFSLLHCGALLRIIEPGVDDEKVQRITVLDPTGLDKQTVEAFLNTPYKVELVAQWIQHMIIAGINEKIITAPPPIVSRSFQELGQGLVKYHDALKVKTIRFPEAYALVCEILLAMHWCVTPFLTALWVNSPALAFFFTFLQVFSLWVLCLVSEAIENPFRTRGFIETAGHMQKELNCHLMQLLNPVVTLIPTMAPMSDEKLYTHQFEQMDLEAFVDCVDYPERQDAHGWAKHEARTAEDLANRLRAGSGSGSDVLNPKVEARSSKIQRLFGQMPQTDPSPDDSRSRPTSPTEFASPVPLAEIPNSRELTTQPNADWQPGDGPGVVPGRNPLEVGNPPPSQNADGNPSPPPAARRNGEAEPNPGEEKFRSENDVATV